MVYNGFNFWIMVTLNMLSLNYYNHQAINNMSSNSRKNSIFLSNDFFLLYVVLHVQQEFYSFIILNILNFPILISKNWTALKEGGNPFRTTHPLRRFAAQVNLPFTFTYTIEENTRHWLHVSFKFNISLRSGYRAQCRPFV